jgi:hypothetical protein
MERNNSNYKLKKKVRKNKALMEVKATKRIRKRRLRKKRRVKEKNKPVYLIKSLLRNSLWVLVKDKLKVPMKMKSLA